LKLDASWCHAKDLTMPEFNLDRFVTAQAPIYATVTAELAAGAKRTHWMWFVFPQMRGLGHSDTARFYGIASREEAQAYLEHAVLGPRLRECTALVNHVQGRSAHAIFGSPDDLKFCSSMTLFNAVAPGDGFDAALRKYFGGVPDQRTLTLLRDPD
jgi:uncharacterized protein (DUF1810 family)